MTTIQEFLRISIIIVLLIISLGLLSYYFYIIYKAIKEIRLSILIRKLRNKRTREQNLIKKYIKEGRDLKELEEKGIKFKMPL